jgi:hypothetical protein
MKTLVFAFLALVFVACDPSDQPTVADLYPHYPGWELIEGMTPDRTVGTDECRASVDNVAACVMADGTCAVAIQFHGACFGQPPPDAERCPHDLNDDGFCAGGIDPLDLRWYIWVGE